MSLPTILSLKKSGEALYIKHVVASQMALQKQNNLQKTKEAVEEEISALKEELNENTEILEASVQGKFGKQAKKAIETETEKVDNF